MRYLLITFLGCAVLITQAQQDKDLLDLSLEDLLNIEIVSASKKEESIFDAPLASYVITRDEIKNSGVNSIPEAMRLCPGVIVRETTNGNYDIHLRGFDNLIRYSNADEQFNQYTLLMIDNRPVFNYGRGGTFWETLPVDLIDVDRIEIVQGPAAPLFGPNAVTGVINIITNSGRSDEYDPLYVSGNLAAGSVSTTIGNVAVGYRFSDKVNATVSANFQARERHDDQFYDLVSGTFTDNPDTMLVQGTPTPFGVIDESLAVERLGVNGFVNAMPMEDLNLNLSFGYQDASAQRPGGIARSILTVSTSEINSAYATLSGNYKKFNFRLSSHSGTDDLEATEFQAAGLTSGIYDFNIQSLDFYQDIDLIDGLRITPGFNYQSIVFDDTPYPNNNGAISGLYNAENQLEILGGSLRLDYNLLDGLRVIAAARYDNYNVPDTSYLAYQFASTYRLNDNLLFRASYSQSNVSAFMINSFQNTTAPAQTGFGTASLTGNENLELTTNKSFELGARLQLSGKASIDVAYYNQKMENLYSRDIAFNPATGVLIQIQNRSMVAVQDGFTLNVNFVVNEALQVRPFATWQVTNVDNVGENPDSLFNAVHKATPTVYGGFFINYRATSKLNVNLTSYLFGDHQGYTRFDEAEARPIGFIDSKFLLNAKVSYQVANKLDVYVNARNLLGTDSREFLANDQISGLYLIGLSYNW